MQEEPKTQEKIIQPPEQQAKKPKLTPEEIRIQKKINKIKQAKEILAAQNKAKISSQQPIQTSSLSEFYKLKRIYDKQQKKEQEEKENIKETFK